MTDWDVLGIVGSVFWAWLFIQLFLYLNCKKVKFNIKAEVLFGALVMAILVQIFILIILITRILYF